MRRGGRAGRRASRQPTCRWIAPRTLDVRGQLQHRPGHALEHCRSATIRLPLEVKDSRAHLGPTQAKLFGGTYDGDIVLDARPARATLSMNEHVKGIDMGALMKAGFDTDRVAGKGNANARLTASGNTDVAMFKSLAGKIDFDIKDGAVNGVDLWYEIRRALALFKRQAAPERAAGAPKTAFDALSGSALVDKGVLRNDDLIADMTYLKVKGKGTPGPGVTGDRLSAHHRGLQAACRRGSGASRPQGGRNTGHHHRHARRHEGTTRCRGIPEGALQEKSGRESG